MEKIICKIDLFDRSQYIFYADGVNTPTVIGTTDINNVGAMIAGLCHNKKVYNASVFGNDEYVSKVVSDIKDSESSMFKNDKIIEIEVNA